MLRTAVVGTSMWRTSLTRRSLQPHIASGRTPSSANGPLRRISPQFEAREHHAVSTWNGDAATFIVGVNGHLRGGAEHTRIVQSQDVSAPSELRVGSAAGYQRSWAYSFFAGTPGGVAKFFQGKEFSPCKLPFPPPIRGHGPDQGCDVLFHPAAGPVRWWWRVG
jgi:hypothetical protein